MTSPSDAPRGTSGALDRLADALESRNDIQDRLVSVVEETVAEVRELRTAIESKATREETEYKRRRVAALLALYGLLIIWGHDAHVEHCGPGSRAEAVIREVASTPQTEPLTLERVKEIVSAQQETTLCDATFPFHGHDDRGWPTRGAVIGLIGYSIAIGAVILYLERGRRAWNRTRRGQ